METSEIKDIACNYKYAVAIIDKGEIRQWGKYLLDKNIDDKKEKKDPKEKKKEEGEVESKVLQMSKFPGHNKFSVLMETVNTGPNHSVAIS